MKLDLHFPKCLDDVDVDNIQFYMKVLYANRTPKQRMDSCPKCDSIQYNMRFTHPCPSLAMASRSCNGCKLSLHL